MVLRCGTLAPTRKTAWRAAVLCRAALQLVHGAANGPPGVQGLVFPVGDPPGLIDDDARGLGSRFPHPGIGGKFLRRVTGDIAQHERHGGILANRAAWCQTGGYHREHNGLVIAVAMAGRRASRYPTLSGEGIGVVTRPRAERLR